MNSYQSAAEYLGSKADRPAPTSGKRNRITRTGPDSIVVRQHGSDVVTFRADGSVVLDSCGWRTVTTKARINEYAPFGRVYSDKGIWYFQVGPWGEGDPHVFADGMELHPDGSVKGAGEVGEADRIKRLRRKVEKYAAGFVAALWKGEIKAPGAGDCWGCLFVAKGETNGGQVMGTGHYADHLEEKYYVPSLLRNATIALGGSQAEQMTIQSLWGGPGTPWPGSVEEGSKGFIYLGIKKRIKRFVLREMGV